MNIHKYFWDLKTATNYSDCVVKQFASHTTYGGGTFKWIIGDNTGIVDVPGIRIKPSSITLGYWERLDMTDVNVDWFGVTHTNTTFATLGVLQGTIDIEYPGIGATTADSPDWAAMQGAMNYAIANFLPLINQGFEYYISQSLVVTKYFNLLIWNGNSSIIRPTASGSWPMVTIDSPTSYGDANSMIAVANMRLSNLRFSHDGSGNRMLQTGIYFKCVGGAIIENCYFYSLTCPMYLRFCLRTQINKCGAIYCLNGFTLDYGDWTGASNSNSQCNSSIFRECYYYAADSTEAFKIIAASGCRVEDCIVEGASIDNAIWVDSDGSSVVKEFNVHNLHVECNWGSNLTNPSSNNMSLGTGNYTFTIPVNSKVFIGAECWVTAYVNGDNNTKLKYMIGTITAWTPGTGSVTVNVTSFVNDLTYTANINFSVWHLVIIYGCLNSVIKADWGGGVIVIDGVFSQYAAILLDLNSSTITGVVVKNIPTWVTAAGKVFRMQGQVNLLWYWTLNLYIDVADTVNRFDLTKGLGTTNGVASSLVPWGTNSSGGGIKHMVVPFMT